MGTTQYILQEIAKERLRQDEKWGVQNHSNGTPYGDAEEKANFFKWANEVGGSNWAEILLEEVYEALAEKDPRNLRGELVQVAAIATAWIDAIDRRKHEPITNDIRKDQSKETTKA